MHYFDPQKKVAVQFSLYTTFVELYFYQTRTKTQSISSCPHFHSPKYQKIIKDWVLTSRGSSWVQKGLGGPTTAGIGFSNCNFTSFKWNQDKMRLKV